MTAEDYRLFWPWFLITVEEIDHVQLWWYASKWKSSRQLFGD
jgi:hypothetical protein